MSAKRGRVPGTPSAIPATAKPLRLRNVTLNLEGVPMNVIEHEPEGYEFVLGPVALTLRFPMSEDDAKAVQHALERDAAPRIDVFPAGALPRP